MGYGVVVSSERSEAAKQGELSNRPVGRAVLNEGVKGTNGVATAEGAA